MIQTQASKAFMIGVVLTMVAGCSETTYPLPAKSTDHPAPWDPDTPYEPGIVASALSTEITNAFFPGPQGARWVYEGMSDEGMEHIEVYVEEETRDVWGVTATVIRDTVELEGEMVEDTWDWYGQDEDGHVWYLGEETYEYEDGVEVCDCGAWESGVDGALPGILMLADPHVGDAYRQEYLAGEAEDLAEVVELNVTVTVAAGTFSGCIRVREVTPLERDVEEFKTACPGIGVVLEEVPEEDERIELIEYSGLTPQ